MSVVRMSKVAVLCHGSERAALVETMHALGLFEINHFRETHPEPEMAAFFPETSDTPKDLAEMVNRVRTAAAFLDEYRPPRGGLAKFAGEKVEITEGEYRRIGDDDALGGLVDECVRLQKRNSELLSGLEKARNQKTFLKPWLSVSLPLEEIAPTPYTMIRLGVLPGTDVPALTDVLPPEVHFEVVHRDQRDTCFALIFHRDVSGEMEDLLKRFDVNDVSLAGWSGLPRAAMEEIDGRIETWQREREEIETRARELADGRSKLLVLEDALSNRLSRETVGEKFAYTASSCLIEGWLKKRDVGRIREDLESSFETVSVLDMPVREDETPPVELRNRPWAKPFEMVTDLYGRPKYTEIDPTPILTPFFAIFFALCVTDAGYGLVLSLIALTALLKLRLSPGMKKLFQLLLMSGLLTIAAGIITGGYFGLDLNTMNPQNPFVKHAEKLKLFDPLEDAMTFFALAIACGVLHLMVGYAVKLSEGIKDGRAIQSLLVYVPWLLTTFGLGMAMIGFIVTIPASLATVSTYALLIGAGGIFLFNGVGSTSVIGHIGKGLSGLYGIIGIFGDILSYSRLLALGLATAVVAGVIDTLGAMVMQIPVVGILITVVMVVVAHLFYLVITCLGAFVHTSRLHFVEFFAKFYEGGGKPFEPFQEENEHTIVLTE